MERELAALDIALREESDKAAALAMKKYMRGQFDYLGLRSPTRRAAQKPTLLASKGASEAELLDFADACWGKPHREFQYVAVDVLRKRRATLTFDALEPVTELIVTKSWWDTVDFLAPQIVGHLAQRFPPIVDVMDRWVEDQNIWLARSALLFQLMYKEQTDPERLFRYCDQRAGDTEFFIRKAMGWALRQYGRVDANAVREYVRSNDGVLSGLTKREALKHIKKSSE